MSTINKRVLDIIKELHNGNKRAFAAFLGVAPTVVENIVGKRQGNPSYEVLVAIYAKANVSADWLLLGEGPMLRHEENSNHIPDDGKMIETSTATASEQSDSSLTSYLQGENAKLHARVRELERNNAILEYRLEQFVSSK